MLTLLFVIGIILCVLWLVGLFARRTFWRVSPYSTYYCNYSRSNLAGKDLIKVMQNTQ